MSNDYTDYQKPVSDDAMAKLAKLAQDQLDCEQRVESAKQYLKRAEDELRTVAEVSIPELMDEMGMTEFKTKTGLKIIVSEKIRASITAAKRNQAFKWLRDNGHAALIKRVVKVQFGMGEDAQAEAAIKKLGDLPVEDDSSVHNQTLVKFVGEMLKDGRDVPEELFNIHRQRFTKVKV